MNYSARYEFRNDYCKNGHCKGEVIYYEALNAKDAAESFLRWYKNRQRNVNDYFGELLSVRILTLQIERVDELGRLNLPERVCVCNWKIDNIAGLTFEQWVKIHYK